MKTQVLNLAKILLSIAAISSCTSNNNKIRKMQPLGFKGPNMKDINEKYIEDDHNKNVPRDGLNLKVLCGNCKEEPIINLGYENIYLEEDSLEDKNLFDLGGVLGKIVCTNCNQRCHKNNEAKIIDVYIKDCVCKGNGIVNNNKLEKIRIQETHMTCIDDNNYLEFTGKELNWRLCIFIINKVSEEETKRHLIKELDKYMEAHIFEEIPNVVDEVVRKVNEELRSGGLMKKWELVYKIVHESGKNYRMSLFSRPLELFIEKLKNIPIKNIEVGLEYLLLGRDYKNYKGRYITENNVDAKIMIGAAKKILDQRTSEINNSVLTSLYEELYKSFCKTVENRRKTIEERIHKLTNDNINDNEEEKEKEE